MSYLSSHFKSVVAKEELRAKLFENYYQMIMKFHSLDDNSSIVDLGCSIGDWLYFLKKKGFKNLLGFDGDEESISVGVNKHTLDLRHQDLTETAEYLIASDKKHDIITIFNVLEHINWKTTVDILDAISDCLKPGGLLCIKVPNGGTLYNNRWLNDDLTHIERFTVVSFSQLVNMTKMKDATLNFIDDNWYYQGKKGFLRKFVFRIFTFLDKTIYGQKTSLLEQLPTLFVILKKND